MKPIRYILTAFVFLFCVMAVETAFAQNVGISTTSGFTPDASAGLDISYTSKGLLIPRVALTAANAAGPIASPATSLLVYNTATAGTSPNNVIPGYYYWNGTAWNMLSTTAQTASSAWATTGNAGINYKTNFLGTTDNQSLRFRTNNTQRFLLDSLGNAAVGSAPSFSANIEKLLVDAGTTSSFNVISGKGNINNYLQLNIQNSNAGTAASSDVVATADNGSETANYVDMGINSSANTSTGVIGGVNTAYLYSAANDFAIGNASSGKNLLFFNGGTGAYEKMRIAANGKVGINIQNPTNPLVVKDTLEIRRTGTLSELLFSNTASSGDMRIAGDGGDIFWQGGGGRNLQMGSYWTTILAGDRQGAIPAFSNGTGGTGVLVLAQRDASVPLAIQGNSATQSANLTEWRTSAGTVLNAVTQNGNFGIGTTTPATKLHVFGANPLTLSGVVTGTSTSADSLLTITSGLVRKLPISTFTSTGTDWLTTGNAGTTAGTNFIGTTDAIDFVVKTNNTEKARFASNGDVSIGGTAFNGTNPEQFLVDAGTTSSINVISGKGNLNNYLQLNIQNNNAGTAASSDVVATADNGSETVNYVDMGINSSANTAAFFGAANDAYLYNAGGTVGGNFFIGTSTSGKSLAFMTGGGATTNERMRILSTGQVGIGTTTPASDFTLYQSTASGGGKGFRFTGNSIGNTNSGTGFLFSLGYNTTGNKQIWFGDPDGAGNNASTFLRIAAATTTLPTLDAISGDNVNRRFLALGTAGDANGGVLFGNNATTTSPSSFVWDNGNMAIGSGYRANAAPTDGLLVQGNVGIGITAPAAKLDVQGTVNLGVGGTTFNNIMRGSFALSSSTTIDNNNKLAFTVTITGVTTGANVILNPTAALPGTLGIASVRVSAANTIVVAITNTSATATALGSVTFTYTIIQ